MVVVAQLVSASGCGPEGRRFKSGLPPHFFCLNYGGALLRIADFFALKVKLSAKKSPIRRAPLIQSGFYAVKRAPPELGGGCPAPAIPPTHGLTSGCALVCGPEGRKDQRGLRGERENFGKKSPIRRAPLIQSGFYALKRAPPAAVWWLPGCFARPARCGLRPCVWPQMAVDLSRRNLQSR